MRRRHFLTAAASLLGPGVLARIALGQTATEEPPPGIDIPGFGRLSLDPADYDAEQIAKLFEGDFSGAVDALRAHYGDAVKAISSGDGTQLAKLAGPLIQQASIAAALPFVGNGLEEALMTAPEPEAIQQGSGAPVYYVNGIFTTHAMAREEARELAGRLPGRPVSLLYNEGTPPSTNRQLAGRDLEEAYRDRVWPVQLTRTLSGKSLGAGLKAALSGDSPLQHNPTTRQLAKLMHDHATGSPEAPFAVVGYSQGSMIARNALFTMAILGKQEFVEKRVAFVAPGMPINRQEVWPVPKKFTPLVDPADPVPAYFGLEGEGFRTQGAAVQHHTWFDKGYVSRIKPEMLTL